MHVCVGRVVRATEIELSYSRRSGQNVGDRTPETKPPLEGYSMVDA